MLSGFIDTLKSRGPVTTAKATVNEINGVLNQRLFRKRFLKKQINDYYMYLDLQDKGISRSLLLFGKRELDHKMMLKVILKPGMRVLDIGANIGYYALMESNMVGNSGFVLGIEPSPANVKLLRRNIALNAKSNIETMEGAVSNESGTKTLYLAQHSNLNTFHPTGTGLKYLSDDKVDVKTYTVPELFKKFGKFDIMRMDVEGHEVDILNGMMDPIAAAEMSPKVIFETHISRYSKSNDMEQTLSRLFSCGYKVTLASSSSQNGTAIVKSKGYKSFLEIPTDGVVRELFRNLTPEHAIEFICKTGGLRTVLLEK